MDEEEDDLPRLRLLVHFPLEDERDLLPLPLWVLVLRCRLWPPLRDADRDLDLIRLSWDPTDLDLVRRLCCAFLDLCRLVVVVGLESFRPYLGRRCWLEVVVVSVVAVWSVSVLVVVAPVPCPDICLPGESGGVELVTGANTVSLLIITSHCPVELNLGASSANSI